MIDYSSLINAVKPSQRTTRYKVLAALYSLGGEAAGVTSSNIAKLMKIQFGKNVPANLTAKLRSYGKYIRIGDAGPPHKWLLTSAGIEILQKTSRLSLDRTISGGDFDADIGVICALENPEFTAFTAAIGESAEWRDVSDARYTHIYRECHILTNSGRRLRLVATTSTSMGLTAMPQKTARTLG